MFSSSTGMKIERMDKMGTIIQNTIAGFLIISLLGYLIYRMGNKVKSLSSKWSADCHDEEKKEECDSCIIAPKNRGIVSNLQKTL